MPRARPAMSPASSTLEVWDDALCRVGAAVASARLEALGRLAPHAAERFAEVSGGGRLALAYESAWLEPEICEGALADPGALDQGRLQKALGVAVEGARAKELERGVSLVGPQRDDVGVQLGSAVEDDALDARSFASQGDQRTAALALKLAESDLLTEASGARPILLLDDVFSELDPSRRTWLAEAVSELGQVIVSSAEPDAAKAAAQSRVFEVEAGKVSVRG